MIGKRRPARSLLAAVLGISVMVGLNHQAAAEPKMTLKLGHIANEDNIWHKAFLKFAEEVSNRTNGEVAVKIYPNEQLGKEVDEIKGVQMGTVDFSMIGESLQTWVPSAVLIGVPYAIHSIDHLDRIVQGPIGDKIKKDIVEKTGLEPIAYFARGPRNLTSNRPIKTPDDLQGIKLRVSNVPLHVKVWEALGAKVTPMSLSEVFTSLQNHTIEAQENPLAFIKSQSFYEVQDYVNKTEHVITWIYIVGNAKRLAKMDPRYRDAIYESAKVMQAYERQLFLQDEQKLEAEMKEKGMTFVDADKAAFAAKAKGAIKDALSPELFDLYEQILATE
ncbi:TRAP transporter substrate-binding protein [Shumkonia mesophila]|uniref:TRAP transporter substrate-binding protein n=1 Tax=Shumkonia mesophila TaxID=2838854 RepID=UPI0029352B65|nr:TRAP transporter substrate-binding protein [Shumkonia mesophila]